MVLQQPACNQDDESHVPRMAERKDRMGLQLEEFAKLHLDCWIPALQLLGEINPCLLGFLSLASKCNPICFDK